MKLLISTLALMLPAVSALAVMPQEEQVGKDLNPAFSNDLKHLMKKSADEGNQNSFFEGFEGRDPYGFGAAANAWLPSGWTQFSRAGNTHAAANNGFWDLTWITFHNDQTGSVPANDQTASYDGDCFAYIMADVMWGGKPAYPDLGGEPCNRMQDEWLVTPSIKPAEEEWFYFQVQFRPGWSLYNRAANDFTGENNLLEVYVTEGNGTTDSEWTKLWSLKEYIESHYTQEELRADLTSLNRPDYTPVYVKVSDYIGKNIKIALRYFGNNGMGIAIDNVAVGIPMPKPSYTAPAGFFKQQSLTPIMEEITGTPQMLIPIGVEATWKNTSRDILTNEWSFIAADGTTATSDAYHLTSPAYPIGKYEAPVLTGMFESRKATYQTPYKAMQAGGRLYGTGVQGFEGNLGVANYDYLDPTASFNQASDYIGFFNGLNESWELILGRMPNTIDVLGMGTVYYASVGTYGIEYVDIFAKVSNADNKPQLSKETKLGVVVYALPKNEYESAVVIGQGMLTGENINAMTDLGAGYKNLHFVLDVPAVVSGDALVLFLPLNIAEGDKFVFPYLKSKDDNIWGTSVVYMNVYESEENGGTYDTFYNLNSFSMNNGHFAGLTMSLGAVYSYMETPEYDGQAIELPVEGGEYKVKVRSMYAPSNWTVTENHANKSTWVELIADNTPVEGDDIYEATLWFGPNTTDQARDTEVYIAQPGSHVAVKVWQAADMTGLKGLNVESTMKVSKLGSSVHISGVNGTVAVYNTTGVKVAQVEAEGSATIETGMLPAGVYIVNNGKQAVKIVL